MTELRPRMIAGLQLRGLSARTPAMDVRAVRPLAAHDHTSPDVITEEARRQDFRSLKNVTPSSRRASTIARCGITFCFEHTRHREWTTRRCVRAPREPKLPAIRSFEEVRGLLGGGRWPRSRVCLSTIASGGRRRPEGTPLQGRAIDRARLLIHVRHGNGGKARDVPRPHRTLERLRHSWGTPRHPVLLVPAPGRGGTGWSTATAPRPRNRVQGACREAVPDRGLHNPASVPTRRHAWAPHVLEAGVNRRRIHADRGHRSPTPTSVSTPRTARAEHRGAPAIKRLLAARCWWRALRCSASLARRTARHVATGCGPVLGGPGRIASGVAPRLSAARSLTVRPAKRLLTAPTLVRTGPVPRASRTRPRRGGHRHSGCGCRCRPSG
jgi:integrase